MLKSGVSGMVANTCKPQNSRPRAVSLFSGAGGMDIGVEAAGFTNVCSIELDANAAETLRQNAKMSGLTKLVVEGDIRQVAPQDVAPVGVELLHGGPPCQAFSLIGKRGSLSDSRGLLLFEMVRFARHLRPQVVLVEQVKGLLSAPDETGRRGGVLIRFVDELQALGYRVQWRVLMAAAFGVPQLRQRVFVVATRSGRDFSFPTPTHDDAESDTPLLPSSPFVGVGAVLDGLPKPRRKDKPAKFPNHVDVTPKRDRERIRLVPEGSFLANVEGVGPEIRGTLTRKDTTKYRRLHRGLPSLTLRCGEIFFHPTEDRYLTPREYMRIHGYPDSHVLFGPIRSRSGTVRTLDQHRLVANSVPPALAYVVARQAFESL